MPSSYGESSSEEVGMCSSSQSDSAGVQCSELNCLSSASSWVWGDMKSDGSQTVTLYNCINRPLSFLSVSNCKDKCTKSEDVVPSQKLYTVTIPSGVSCTSVCVYGHDGQYKMQYPNMVSIADDSSCISSSEQRCNLCDYQFNICKTTAAPAVQVPAVPTASPTFRPSEKLSR